MSDVKGLLTSAWRRLSNLCQTENGCFPFWGRWESIVGMCRVYVRNK